MNLSYSLESEIAERLYTANEESDGENLMTREDVLQELMQDCDDREHWTYAYRKELHLLGISLGVYAPMTAEQIKNTVVMGKNSKAYDFKLGGVAYQFVSWKPLAI